MTNHEALKIMKHTEIVMTNRMVRYRLNLEDHEELCHRVYEKLMLRLAQHPHDAAKGSLVTYANACVDVLVKKVCEARIEEVTRGQHNVAADDSSRLLERALQQQRRMTLQKAQLAQRLADAIAALEPKYRVMAHMLKENPKLTIRDLAETFCMDYDLFHHTVWRKFCRDLATALQIGKGEQE